LAKSYLKIPIPAYFLRLCVWFVLLYREKHFGTAFRKIWLTQCKFAIVSPEDFETLNSHKWHVTGCDKNFYAIRYLGQINGKKKFISMHRFIMNPPPGLIVDHIDGVGLNNTRGNLRIATIAQNTYNCRKTYRKTRSQYKGVCYDTQRNSFRADIRYKCKRRFLGHFDNETDAAKAYDKAALELFGDYANLNFPKDGGRPNNDLYNRICSSRIERLIDRLSNLFGV
jgi:hypothetical protein